MSSREIVVKLNLSDIATPVLQRILRSPTMLSLRLASARAVLNDPGRDVEAKTEALELLATVYRDAVDELRAMAQDESQHDDEKFLRLCSIRDGAQALLGDSQGRVLYRHLNAGEQQALHDWCTLHGVDYKRVPVDPLIEHDGREWRIEVLHLRDGRVHLDKTGERIATVILRRAWKADLPWPSVRPAEFLWRERP